MSIHLVIIDALNLIRRVHAVQPDPNDIERTIQTTSRTLRRIVDEAQPTHIIAVFDHHEQDRGWRGDILPEYKQNRKSMPEPLYNGLDKIQDAWWQLGIDSLLSEGDEADDLVATLAVKVASHGEKVTIVSTDKAIANCSPQRYKFATTFSIAGSTLRLSNKNLGLSLSSLPTIGG
ncbi:DNA polymerase I [Vibrio variabilis]|uniref:DNA polymerase I n=1 Tax=Vibrio variabilis TaxID=990271 RepID=A0ABQ0J863_9VIBR|nr:DNA polymerase I [Vibrio variabilis]